MTTRDLRGRATSSATSITASEWSSARTCSGRCDSFAARGIWTERRLPFLSLRVELNSSLPTRSLRTRSRVSCYREHHSGFGQTTRVFRRSLRPSSRLHKIQGSSGSSRGSSHGFPLGSGRAPRISCPRLGHNEVSNPGRTRYGRSSPSGKSANSWPRQSPPRNTRRWNAPGGKLRSARLSAARSRSSLRSACVSEGRR